MNRIQMFVAEATGLADQLDDLREVQEHLISDNAMLQRTIEDLDYLNLFDVQNITDILPIGDRRKVLGRLRRLRHSHPLAKQAVKLTLRFTLGKGVQYVVTPKKSSEPPPVSSQPEPSEDGGDQSKGLPPPPTKLIQLPRAARAREDNGAEPELLDENDQVRKIIRSFWNDPDNQIALTSRQAQKQNLDDVITDGEKFFLFYEAPAEPYVKVSELPTEEVNLIIYDPDNRIRPVWYRRTFMEQIYDGNSEQYKPEGEPKTRYYLDYRIKDEDLTRIGSRVTIPSAKQAKDEKGNFIRVKHRMINPITTTKGRRGVSELFASQDWFRVFKSFMEGRAAINEAATAISYKRKIKGGQTAMARFKGKLGNLSVGYDNPDNPNEVRKLTRPAGGAAVYDSNEGVDLDWMKTDTGAANAKEDARMLLSTAGAGVGMMNHYFGEGGDANLATAQSMELPMVKSFEDWQQDEEDFFIEVCHRVITVALSDEVANEEIERVGFEFPPIISQDVVKHMTAWAQVVRDIAPNNRVVRAQAIRGALTVMKVPNLDGLMPQIEAEMEQAELERQQREQEMIAAMQNGGNGNEPPVAGKIPTSGLDPNTQRIAQGRGQKVANGPKPER